ncbi:MAG TPA: lytic transglycosylase domain-containing protein [Chitinophagaceae bacterium]|nr:lytic transglycosylase domain-containing protein [Chitinophagaceae bacterium]
MLHSKLSKAVFIGHLLLFLILPFTSFQHPKDISVLAEDTNCIAPATAVQQVQLNKNAVKFVHSYLNKNNEDLVKIKERSVSPFRTIDGVLRKYGLPTQLKYLAVIESELKSSAVSRVGAAGTWQLMPTTARLLGLKVTKGYDERRLLGKSTKAAALYLRDLYGEFGDWLLVMAAYNCGPGPVYSAIRKSGSRNFWRLQYHLPAESRDHVKKFIATHYYFEGNGSITTLTKAECVQYNTAVMLLATKQVKLPLPSVDNQARQNIAFGN